MGASDRRSCLSAEVHTVARLLRPKRSRSFREALGWRSPGFTHALATPPFLLWTQRHHCPYIRPAGDASCAHATSALPPSCDRTPCRQGGDAGDAHWTATCPPRARRSERCRCGAMCQGSWPATRASSGRGVFWRGKRADWGEKSVPSMRIDQRIS